MELWKRFHEEPRHAGPSARPGRLLWLALAAGLAIAVVVWEYLLNTVMNPDVAWNLGGVFAHMGLDLLLMLPLVALALGLGIKAARKLSMRNDDLAGVLGTVGVVAMVLLAMMLPLSASRDLAHEWVGTTYGISLAEVQTTVVRSDLTVQEATQLCSFATVRNPSLAGGDDGQGAALLARLQNGFTDALVQQAVLLPLLFLGLFGLYRRGLKGAQWTPVFVSARWLARPARLSVLGLGALVLFCIGYTVEEPGNPIAHAQNPGAPFNACSDGGAVRQYEVSAIPITITLNRWGDHVKDAYMYALDANIPTIEAFAQALEDDRDAPESRDVTRVSPGLRKDPIQPLVLRANLGECLRVQFTNRLADGQPASMHILGLPHTVENASSAVGENPDTFAGPGQTLTYEIPIPLDSDAERAYYFHDHGAGRRRQSMGLFGAIIAEPAGSHYLDVETGQELTTDTGSNWEAIIVVDPNDPNYNPSPDNKNFREFVIFYHEIGDEAFTDIRDRENKKLPLVDDVAGIYRPAARGLNYRSEPFRRRIEEDKKINGKDGGGGKSQGYNSYSFADPPTPIPRSYLGEGTKTRLLHGGSEVFHVHHLHGGADRWRRNPNADPNNDFWKGLTKVPDPNLSSIHLDSQSIGPGTSYNLEHECGAGGCQQGVGEFLYHCHIGHHYLSGMWSLWRVFGTVQTAETNINGFPLAVVSDLFQSESPLQPTTPPESGVSAGGLLGVVVDGGRVLSAGPTTGTEKNLVEWIEELLPPAGVPLHANDATVWNWTMTGEGADLKVFGEPEQSVEMNFANYVSPTPNQRPEVLFNPKNGRYTWPLFRPHNSQRPPFTARHTGAPWLGEQMDVGRLDGLCATPELVPEIGPQAAKRFYPVSAITLPIQITRDKTDRNGMIFALNEHEEGIREGTLPTEPLAIRSNVGDCVEILFTNKIPDGPLNKNFSKVNIHSHFVQFDTQASDGVMTGFSYEQSLRPFVNENRFLTETAGPGDTVLHVNHTNDLHPELLADGGKGIWIGVGLGEGTCGTNAQGQPVPCTEIRQIVGLTENTITLDRPLDHNHPVDQAVGVEFVRYHWFSDVDFGTVFYHQHVEFKDWDHGLFGTHIVEPKGSTYHNPVTGQEVRAGTLVDIRVDPAAGGNPVAHNVNGSFREFMLFLHNQSPVEGAFVQGGGTINLRAEPWRLRSSGDPAHLFSSVTHGDPHTQEIRAYVGDPVIIRGMGLVERVGGIRFTGHRFQQERNNAASDTRDTTFIGISERFDVSLEGGAGGTGGYPGDYLYYSTLGRDFQSGAWGLLRVHDTLQGDLQPLPDRPGPGAGSGFPQLTQTGGAPPVSPQTLGRGCPAGAPLREYSVEISDTTIVFNDRMIPDRSGVAYSLLGEATDRTRTPLVLRANEGDCLRVSLTNSRGERSGFNLGEVVFDPQSSYGGAVGFNFDSTVAPGAVRSYEYYADAELGLVLALNLGNMASVENGAFGGLVVEPEGATYTRPGTGEGLPGGGVGIQADIHFDNVTMREMVALFSDRDRRIGASAMPYPVNIERFSGINYSNDPLSRRDMRNRPAEVFKSSLWGDPRHVVTVPAGTPLIYRVGHAWGDQAHVPTLEGHRWFLEPGMPGSEQVYADVLVPGHSLNLFFVGGAGGDFANPGDYLFLDRRQPFLEGGLWHVLRVTDGEAVGSDSVLITGMNTEPQEEGTLLSLSGINGVRPAGDTAPMVTIHQGSAVDGRCWGPIVGRAPVDPGSGVWTFRQVLSREPSEVCIRSSGGGIASELM